MEITVAICTFNPDMQLLLRVLNAIFPQTQIVDSEIIIIDNNSRIPLSTMPDLVSLPISIIREENQGLTAAREAAINAANGKIILFVDDDNVLAPLYIENVIKSFLDESIGLLGGGIFPEYRSPPPAWFKEFEPMLAIRRHPPKKLTNIVSPPYTEDFPVGAGFAVRSNIARAYVAAYSREGRIEGRKGTSLSSGEDLDMDLFVLHLGYKLQINGCLVVTHVIASSRLNAVYASKLARASVASTLEIEKKWRDLFKQQIFPAFYTAQWKLWLRIILCKFLSAFSLRYTVKHAYWSELRTAQARLNRA